MSGLGAAMFAADMGRRAHEPDGVAEEDDAKATETAQMERRYFNLARDTNEVLVSDLHDAAARNQVAALREALGADHKRLNEQDSGE